MFDEEQSWGKISKAPWPKLNNRPSRRLNFKQAEPQGGMNVVKGISHRVIVVKSPDKRFFEEAIFVIREDVLNTRGVDSKALILEATKVANSYAWGCKPPRKQHFSTLPAPIFAAVGAAVAGAAFFAAHLCGI